MCWKRHHPFAFNFESTIAWAIFWGYESTYYWICSNFNKYKTNKHKNKTKHSFRDHKNLQLHKRFSHWHELSTLDRLCVELRRSQGIRQRESSAPMRPCNLPESQTAYAKPPAWNQPTTATWAILIKSPEKKTDKTFCCFWKMNFTVIKEAKRNFLQEHPSGP